MSNSDDEKQMAKACDMQGLSQEFAALLAERDALQSTNGQLSANLEGWMIAAACGWIHELKAENAALKADAERWRYFVTHCEWLRRDEIGSRYSSMSLRLPYWTDQSCVAMRNHAIDTLMKEQTL